MIYLWKFQFLKIFYSDPYLIGFLAMVFWGLWSIPDHPAKIPPLTSLNFLISHFQHTVPLILLLCTIPGLFSKVFSREWFSKYYLVGSGTKLFESGNSCINWVSSGLMGVDRKFGEEIPIRELPVRDRYISSYFCTAFRISRSLQHWSAYFGYTLMDMLYRIADF